MFFRRAQPKSLTFEERLELVRRAGFEIKPLAAGQYRISRNGCAIVLENAGGGLPRVVEPAGVAMGDDIGALVDGGFQKFFLTPGGKRRPALAEDLRALHDFQEDLREALGQISLYN